MANIISFQMQVRGNQDQIDELYSFIPSDLLEDHREVNGDLITERVRGDARNEITSSFVKPEGRESLQELSRRLNLEIEVFGYDEDEPYLLEHYYYSKGEAIIEACRITFVQAWEVEDGEVEIDLSMYNYREDAELYILKPEFSIPYELDEEEEDFIFQFAME